MKTMKLGFAIAALAMLTVISCGPSAQKVENAKEGLQEAKDEYKQAQIDSVADYERFKLESEARIDSNEMAIQELKMAMKANKQKYHETDQKMIDELEQKNINMRRKIHEYKEEGKDQWAAFKNEFSHDMDELGKAIKGIGVNHNK